MTALGEELFMVQSTAKSLHPYACDAKCAHCKGTVDATHDPVNCYTCIFWGETEKTDKEWQAWMAAPLASEGALKEWQRGVRSW